MTDKLYNKINSIQAYGLMVNLLMDRVVNDIPISENGMVDGLMIGALHSKSITDINLFLSFPDYTRINGKHNSLHMIVNWLSANEDKLCEILSNQKE